MNVTARAFCRLQNEIFRVACVDGVITHGFGHKSNGRPVHIDTSVRVITTGAPDEAGLREIGEIVERVNRRFGTRFIPVFSGPDGGF